VIVGKICDSLDNRRFVVYKRCEILYPLRGRRAGLDSADVVRCDCSLLPPTSLRGYGTNCSQIN
jgi:hypothetical protein